MPKTQTASQTMNQQLAKFLLKNSPASAGDRPISKAFSLLQNDKNSGNEVPEKLWLQVGTGYMKLGLLPLMKDAYAYAQKEVLRRQKLACGRNAVKNGYLSRAIDAYEEANARMPKKEILAKAKNMLLAGEEDSMMEALKTYRRLGAKPPLAALFKARAEALRELMPSIYKEIQESFGHKLDEEFLQGCFEYYKETFNFTALTYVATLLKQKIGKKTFLELGKKALKAGKFSAAEQFLKEAFT